MRGRTLMTTLHLVYKTVATVLVHLDDGVEAQELLGEHGVHAFIVVRREDSRDCLITQS